MASLAFGDLNALWSLASGVAVSLLGVYALRGGKTRPRGALPFGLFALAWGIQVSSVHLARVVDSGVMAERLYLGSLVGLFFLPYFLVEFSASQSPRRGRTPSWYALRGGAAVLAFISVGLFVLKPDLLFQGVIPANETFYPQWGSAFVPLVSIPVFAAIGTALWTLERSVAHSPTRRTEEMNLYFLGGIALYASYTVTDNLLDFAFPIAIDSLSWITYAITFLLLSLLCLFFGGKHLLRWKEKDSRSGMLLATTFLLPSLTALLIFPLNPLGIGDLDVTGLFRLVGVGVITYGFARRRLYDLPQRTRHAGATATGGASALAAGGTGFGVATVLSGGLALPLLAGAAATGATAMPALKWARRLFDVDDEDNPVDEAEQLYEQKIETYRAALEDAMARDTLEEDETFLAGLRERFGISDAEDRILRYYARKATVPRREGDPDTAYERLRIIGEGGAGRTWLARDRSRDRLVVLKEPLEKWHSEPAVLEAARREAQLAAKVRHPNVVEVEEVLEDGNRPVLVMEYVTGGSLADKLRNEGTLDPREAVKIAFDVARGLEAIHDAGIVHRDLTPDNVLLREDGRAMITDFGLARNQDSSGTQLLEDEAGTKGYQAPEAARGSDEPTVDVYGLAAILHTCLYGSPPVQGTVQVEADVRRELQAVIETGLRRDPEDRFADAEAFADALEEVVQA